MIGFDRSSKSFRFVGEALQEEFSDQSAIGISESVTTGGQDANNDKNAKGAAPVAKRWGICFDPFSLDAL